MKIDNILKASLCAFGQNTFDSYSLEDCMDSDKVITRIKECEDKISGFKGVLSSHDTDVSNYINSNNVLKVCSYEYCYDYKGGEMQEYLKNFAVYLDSVYDDDYKILVYFKGYPITKIYYAKD